MLNKIPEYASFKARKENLAKTFFPYYKSYSGIGGIRTDDVREYINFSSFDYLGLASNKKVIEATQSALQNYGTSRSASSLISGRCALHQELETMLAQVLGAENALVFSSGYVTNLNVISYLLNKQDIIFLDVLAHNSLVTGARFSGAKCLFFRHNDMEHLETILKRYRNKYRNALIITEGVFSMDGDIASIPTMINLKRQYDAFLMVDEAHSLGCIGNSGRGIAEYFNISNGDIDIWMGTISKALSSCGGYIAGSYDFIEYLKYSDAAIFSTAVTPASSAAALTALQLMQSEPEYVSTLQNNSRIFYNALKNSDIKIGNFFSHIIPLFIGSDINALFIAEKIQQMGILAFPIVYPAVSQNTARIRFLITATHTPEQLLKAANIVTAVLLEKAAH